MAQIVCSLSLSLPLSLESLVAYIRFSNAAKQIFLLRHEHQRCIRFEFFLFQFAYLFNALNSFSLRRFADYFVFTSHCHFTNQIPQFWMILDNYLFKQIHCSLICSDDKKKPEVECKQLCTRFHIAFAISMHFILLFFFLSFKDRFNLAEVFCNCNSTAMRFNMAFVNLMIFSVLIISALHIYQFRENDTFLYLNEAQISQNIFFSTNKQR